MKKLISMLTITAIAVSTLVGCSKNNTSVDAMAEIHVGSKDTIVMAHSAEPRGLDPALVDDSESAKVVANIYEGLVKFKEGTTEIEPCLATKWKVSEDGKDYTFYLKKGVKFHDDYDFTAEAVKFNVDRQISARAIDMPYSKLVWGQVKKVYIINDYKVKIRLKEPSPTFLTNLAMPLGGSMVSPRTCRSRGFNMNVETSGTGPYKLVRWDKGDQVVLTRNDDYWGEKPQVKNIVFKVIEDKVRRVAALTSGQVDIIDGVSGDSVDEIKAAGFNVSEQDGLNSNYISYNVEQLKDASVRKALSQAVNVPEIVERLYGTSATKATTVVPSSISGYSESVKPVSYDPKAAKATLSKKGVKEIHLVTYKNERPYNMVNGVTLAETLKRYYEAVGLKVKLDTYDWQGYKEKMSVGGFDIACTGWVGDHGEAENFLNGFTSKEWHLNVSRYQNTKYKDLAAQALAEHDETKRQAIYEQMESKLAKEAIVLPISHAKTIAANSPRIGNIPYTNTGIIYMKDVTKSDM